MRDWARTRNWSWERIGVARIGKITCRRLLSIQQEVGHHCSNLESVLGLGHLRHWGMGLAGQVKLVVSGTHDWAEALHKLNAGHAREQVLDVANGQRSSLANTHR